MTVVWSWVSGLHWGGFGGDFEARRAQFRGLAGSFCLFALGEHVHADSVLIVGKL